ncbi:MAG: PilZ domain-containing protein [Candidatus Omnitrophica bacterium]|nr:PilZ domain-containing protein [Candidatus Omnitrophota bacterium]
MDNSDNIYDFKKRERRKYERYETEAKVYFRVIYEIKTKVEFQIADKEEGTLSKKYPAMSKNISAEGLCFISDRQLKKGDRLYLELYLPKREQPIRMEGQVRWSQPASAEEKENNKFETGVKLTVVEGRSVMTSIHYDEANHLVWSITLESIFGNFRKLAQNQ